VTSTPRAHDVTGIRALTAAAAVQGGRGLFRRDWYVDDAWIKATWLGNDAVTLVLVAPLLLASTAGVRRGSVRAAVLQAGLLAYCSYNYAFYLLGARLNVFFPLYVALVLIASCLLARALMHTNVSADHFSGGIAARLAGGWMICVGAGLGLVWLLLWARYVFLDVPTPVPSDAFRLVAALDLTIITPGLVTAGVLVWQRRPWGFFSGALTAIGGTGYLLVLAVNATLAWSRNAADAIEMAVWGSLAILMCTTAAILVRNVLPARLTEASP
jgi:hypothetical protein